MGSPIVPGSDMMKAMGAVWNSDDVKKMLELMGPAARLEIPLFFDFDEDYGWKGAAAQKKLDPYNCWSYELSSWASLFQYEPEHDLSKNTKPVLYTAGEKDPSFPPEVIKAAAGSIGGPVELNIFKDATHQLMLFHTQEFSNAVDAFCRKHI